jgi:hypothetical protein
MSERRSLTKNMRWLCNNPEPEILAETEPDAVLSLKLYMMQQLLEDSTHTNSLYLYRRERGSIYGVHVTSRVFCVSTAFSIKNTQ